jgi:hypothetical protein
MLSLLELGAISMNQPLYFNVEATADHQASQDALSLPADDSLLDDLLHQKSRIFASKLEVLSVAMIVRLEILRENVARIATDKERAGVMLAQMDQQARYHFREHRDKNILYQTLFSLEEQHRSQAVECWRDIVMVLRDFLGVWEAHEQSQARAIFLENVGS